MKDSFHHDITLLTALAFTLLCVAIGEIWYQVHRSGAI